MTAGMSIVIEFLHNNINYIQKHNIKYFLYTYFMT